MNMPLQLLLLEVSTFPPLSLCPCLSCAAAGAVGTCWLITFDRTGLLTLRNFSKELWQSMWPHSSTCLLSSWLLTLNKSAVPKPQFTKQFCIMAGIMDFHAIASMILHFLMSSVSTSLSISHNRKCTLFLRTLVLCSMIPWSGGCM